MSIPPELLDYLAANLTQDDINKMILQYKWASLTKEQKKAAVRKVVDKILVYNDHIQVYLTVDPVLFTPHAIIIGKRRSKNIQDIMMGTDEKPDNEAICLHAMELDTAKKGSEPMN